MKLAIVGSVRLAGNEQAQLKIEEVINLYKPTAIVSGGAKGIDLMAEEECKKRGLEPIIFRPTVQRWKGPGGFEERNIKIATECDRLVRIYSPKSKTWGSGWTKKRAHELGKPTEEHCIWD